MNGKEHHPKGGNSGGSRTSGSSSARVRSSNPFPDDEPNRKNQSPAENRNGGQHGEDIPANDPHKVEKVAKAGREDFDTEAGAD